MRICQLPQIPIKKATPIKISFISLLNTLSLGNMSTYVSMDVPGDSNAANVSNDMWTKDLDMECVQSVYKI